MGRPVEKPDVVGRERQMVEQLCLHVGAIARRVRRRKSDELVEVERADQRPVGSTGQIAATVAEFAIETKPEDGPRPVDDDLEDA